jgi:1-acyl-sn-glycerol-3-phosphate acyltransferase
VSHLYRFYWILLQVVTKFFLGLKRSGLENIPESGGAIIACNHRSVADPPLMGSAVPRGIFYFTKAELFGKWYSSFLIDGLNTIPVKRGSFDRNAFEKGVEVVRNGGWLLVFPEGTRSKTGKLGEGRAGAAKISVEAGVPVVPACILNSDRIKQVLFSRERVTIRFGPPLYPSQYQDVQPVKEKLRAFTSNIMKHIGRLIEEESRE